MSIYENIRFGKINATQTEIEEAALQANAHNFIMQLPDVCHKYLFIVIYKYVRLFIV
jgi:ABC-type multidrug transport system fused ATPase/permease subunit